jgi:hypothetical protein
MVTLQTARGGDAEMPGSWCPRFSFRFLGMCLVFAACAAAPMRNAQAGSAATPTQVPAAPATQVYFYPTAGQSPEQQDRDRYECYLWAVKQTGFDPSQPQLAPHQRVEVVPQPAPGHDTAVGAASGAVFGAIASGPHNTLAGAAIGAVAGAAIGAASDSARQEQARHLQEQYNQRYAQADAQRAAQIDQQAADYRRAMSACLEGRGYAVR